MKVAAIACPNGLGHLRRVMAISEFLYRNNFVGLIDIYALPRHINYLEQSWDIARILIERNTVKTKWLEDLSTESHRIDEIDNKISKEIDFSSYDIVWSDNLLGILDQRPDAKITGSFFWHEVMEKKASQSDYKLKKWISKSRELLRKSNPKIAASQYFVTPEVRKQKNFSPVGLYRYFGLIGEKKSGSILLSCGLGGEEEENVQIALKRIISKKIKPEKYLYVEPRLLPDKYPDWVRPANFTEEMFKHIIASCIRPGLGTISDSLISHNRVFTFESLDSYEMKFNSKILEKMGLGQHHESAFSAYENALLFLRNKKKIDEQITKTLHLRTDGIMATAEFLIN